MRKLILIILVMLAFTSTAQATMTYGASYYRNRIGFAGSGSDTDPIYLFINEVETTIDGTSGVTSIIFTPGTAPSSPSEGQVYYDSASNGLLLYTGAAFVTIDTAGASSLGTAYAVGSAITVNTDAITLTSTDAANNEILALVHGETGNYSAMSITNASAYPAIQITGSSTGDDITGTSGLWTISEAGVGTFASVIVGASGYTGTQSDILNNETNNTWTFDSDTATTEDFSIGLGANTNIITFSSASSADTIEYGTLDDVNGVGNIYFDSAASQITLAANQAADDLTVQVTGALNASLDLRSAGTGVDAVKVYASAGGIDMDATGTTMTMTNTANGDADDFTIEVAGTHNSSLILQSAGTGGDAVSILTSNAAGDIKIYSADVMDIDAVDDITIDISGAGANLDIDSAAGSVYIDGGEADAAAVKLHASATAGGIDIDAGTGGIDVLTTGVISIDGADDMNFTLTSSTDAEDLTIQVDGDDNCSIILDSDGTGTDAIKLNASNAAGGIDVDAGTYGINMKATGGDIKLENTTAKDIILDATAGRVLITGTESAADAIILTADGANGEIALSALVGGLDFDATGGAITIDNTGAGKDIHIDSSAGEIHLIGGQAIATAVVIDAEDAAGGIDMDCGTNGFDLTATGGDITLQNTTAKDIVLDATAGRVLITGTESAADAIILTADGANGEIALSALAGGIDIDATGGVIALDTSGSGKDITLDATEGAVSIDGGETGANAIVIDASHSGGGINMDCGSGGFDLTATGGDITLQNTTAKDIVLDATAGRVLITGTESAADAIILTADGANGEIALTAAAGGLDFDAASGDITIDAAGAAGDEIKLTNTDGTAAGAIALLASAGGITAKVPDGKTIQLSNTGDDTYVKVTPHGTADNEVIQIVNAAGTNNAAIALTSTAGGITAKVADGKELILGNAGSDTYVKVAPHGTPATEIISVVNSAGTADGAVVVTSTAGGIDMNAKEMFTVNVAGGTAADADIILTNEVGTDAAAIALTASAGGIAINGTNSTLVIKNTTNGANDDLTIQVDGDDDAHLKLDCDGTSADAVSIQASAGGFDFDASSDVINIQNAADGDGDDFSLILTGNHNSSIILQSAGSGTDALSLATVTNGGDIKISSNDALDIDVTGAMTLDIAGDASTIQMDSDGAGDNLTIDVDGDDDSHLILSSDGTSVDAIYLHQQTATGGGIKIHADDSTNAASIHLVSDAGGMDVDVAAGKIFDLDAGTIQLDSRTEGAGAIALTVNQGATDTITVTNTQGTDNGAITLTSTAGGITAKVADGKELILGNAGSDTYFKVAPHGTPATEIVTVMNSAGTADGAVVVTSTAGGIDMNAKEMFTVNVAGGTAASADITLTNEVGTDAAAIALVASAGGITLDASTGGITFSDDSVTNVGDIACDDIVADANDNVVISAVKMLVVSISVDDTPDTDFDFDNTQANKTEQGIRVGVLPANCMVNSVFVKCTETLTGSGQMNIEIGTTDEGNEILASSSPDTANDVMGTAAGETPEVAAGTAAIDIWVNGTPVTNDWDEISAGSWDVCIVYTDYASALTQTGT